MTETGQRTRINGITYIDGNAEQRTRINGITYIDGHRRIRGITVYDFGERCLPLSSQPSNSAEFLLHTAAQRMSNNKSVTQQLSARRVYFKHTTTRPLTADPRPTSDFWTGTRFTGLAQLSCGVDVQYFLSIFVIFLLFALKI